MSHLVEFVRVRVHDGQEAEFLAARPAAVEAVRRRIAGFVDAPLIVKVAENEWIDVWIYETEEEAAKANESAADIPEFMAMANVSDVVSVETGHQAPA
ncbi:MAG: hypothetical protein ABWY58_15685 [Aeromicrobium sp.]